jgi:hypothetical protein
MNPLMKIKCSAITLKNIEFRPELSKPTFLLHKFLALKSDVDVIFR